MGYFTSFLWDNHEYILWISIVSMGLTYSGQCPLMLSYGSNLYKQGSSWMFSVFMASCSLGIMIIPSIMGITNQTFSIHAAMIIPSVLLFIVGLIFTYSKDKIKE